MAIAGYRCITAIDSGNFDFFSVGRLVNVRRKAVTKQLLQQEDLYKQRIFKFLFRKRGLRMAYRFYSFTELEHGAKYGERQ